MPRLLITADDFCRSLQKSSAFFIWHHFEILGGLSMLFSLSLILIIGFSLSGILNRFKIPGLIGLIFTGIILGPQGLNLISPDILGISKDLREIALIVILLRAGLTLDLKDLKKVGRPALFMSFLPATFTAPLGTAGIDHLHKKLLVRDQER